jgi:hypothetical protein
MPLRQALSRRALGLRCLRDVRIRRSTIALERRNRYRACREIGIDVRTRDYIGDSPVAFVWSLNGTRRQLSKSQLANVAAKMLGPLKEEAKKRQISGKWVDGSGGRGHSKKPPPNPVEGLPEGRNRRATEALAQAAKLVGVGTTIVQEAKKR